MNNFCKRIRCWSLMALMAIILGMYAYAYSPMVNAVEGPYNGAASIEVISPTRGSHFYTTTAKIEQGETQWVSFTFHTGNVFSKNPNAHLHVRMDSDEVPSDHPLRGRGIVIGDTSKVSGCKEVAFERFSEPNQHPGECGVIGLQDNEEYDVHIQASKGWVAYKIYSITRKIPPSFDPVPKVVRERTLVASNAVHMPDEMVDSDLSGIAFGMAFDKEKSSFRISNIRYGVF